MIIRYTAPTSLRAGSLVTIDMNPYGRQIIASVQSALMVPFIQSCCLKYSLNSGPLFWLLARPASVVAATVNPMTGSSVISSAAVASWKPAYVNDQKIAFGKSDISKFVRTSESFAVSTVGEL